MKRPKPQQLLQHALTTHDNQLAAMIITAAALEILTDPAVAPLPAPTRAAVLATHVINELVPARARA